jgi:hypothetical protein
MPTLAPTARRVCAFAGLTGVLAVPAIALASGPDDAAAGGPAVLSPVTLMAPASTATVIVEHLDRHLAAVRHDRALTSTMRTARHVAKVRGEHLPHGYRSLLKRRTVPALKAKQRRLRRDLREYRATGGAPDVAIPAALASIAACESGGDPGAIGGGGTYRGKYQFSYSTWASVGGQGDPAAAPEAEQDRRAAMLYAQAGAGQWPVCGR